MKASQQIIARIGETDQLSLQAPSPRLNLERAELRLELVCMSQMRQEQQYFLQEAIVLLEQARISDPSSDEGTDKAIDKALFIALTLQLAKAYMLYFELNREAHFALITEQLLKPLAHHDDSEVYFYLAYAAVVREKLAMTRHWLSKYVVSPNFDMALLQQHSAFDALKPLNWFTQMLQQKLH